MEKVTVTLKGVEMTLQPITSPTEANDLYACWATTGSPTRAFSAALGMSWQGSGRKIAKPKARLEQCGFNVARYGGLVYDELVGRGIPETEILRAGKRAFALATANLLTGGDVKRAEAFFGEGEGETSTASSSPSNESGPSTPGGSAA